jgi:pyridoxal 5'-phosphate synthase pdxT subunit
VKVGILALQGAVEPHVAKLESLGIQSVEVRNESDLTGLSGIILPGGESTTMLHLLRLNSLYEPLAKFVSQRPTFGLCAGVILLANKVTSPAQESLGAMPIEVARNAYGRQLDSFVSYLEPTEHFPESNGKPVEGVFIRAPRILSQESGVRILLRHKSEPVMVEYGHILGATFHPELTESTVVHQYFINKCRAN